MVKTAAIPPKTVLKETKAAKAAKQPDLGNGPDLETFHYHVGEIKRRQAAVAAVRKLLKDARRRAQDSGIVLHDLDTIVQMESEEPETVQAAIKRLATYAYWMGLSPGVQGDLFEAAAVAHDGETAAEQEGYVAGLEGETAEGDRYDTTSPIGQARLRGWRRGQDVVLQRFKQPAAPEQPTVQ